MRTAPAAPGFKRKLKRILLNLKFHPRDIDLQTGKKLFFVTGRAKSGTTWMARLLNSHPSLYCGIENLGFQHTFRFQYFADWPDLLAAGSEERLSEKTWTLIKNGLITNLIINCQRLSVQKLGDKTPDQDLHRILEWFPETQIIFMLRDCRDACVSWAFHNAKLRDDWRGIFAGAEKQALDNQTLEYLLGYYKTQPPFEGNARLAAERPEQVKIVRYEDLKSEPVSSLKSMFEFLGVDSSEGLVKRCVEENSLEAYTRGRKHGEAESGSFFRKGIVGDWRNHFSPENTALFKKLAGDLLIAEGYEKDDDWSL